MSAIQARRDRQREARRRAIVEAARRLAEAEGWGAVTVRRLADRIEYSQPVLYSHFRDKQAIVKAVALEGFVELAAVIRGARESSPDPAAAARAVTRAYLAFAAAHPALYEAMFTLSIDVEFGTSSTPAELHAGFDELVAAVAPLGAPQPVEAYTELYWATLHGVADLTRSGRVPPSGISERLAMIDHLFHAA